ncbi:hypothetical protein PVK06_044323 [Gossypium arboreum]|uniref:Uncharacterized protein n=1 Tax=Gossypium arboreum TaxID=29729 RepID=A0ABR0MQW4_GOSAR|nr:hypothetical protein PVK06_044323 [Gossypium arboreum]
MACNSLLGWSPGARKKNFMTLKFSWLSANFKKFSSTTTENELRWATPPGIGTRHFVLVLLVEVDSDVANGPLQDLRIPRRNKMALGSVKDNTNVIFPENMPPQVPNKNSHDLKFSDSTMAKKFGSAFQLPSCAIAINNIYVYFP